MNRQKDYRERKRNMKRKRDICRDIDREREKISEICSVYREKDIDIKKKDRYREKTEKREMYTL